MDTLTAKVYEIADKFSKAYHDDSQGAQTFTDDITRWVDMGLLQWHVFRLMDEVRNQCDTFEEACQWVEERLAEWLVEQDTPCYCGRLPSHCNCP